MSRVVSVYGGVVILTTDEQHIAARLAAGDSDASDDVRAVFAPGTIEASHRDDRMAMGCLAAELRAIADGIVSAARRLP